MSNDNALPSNGQRRFSQKTFCFDLASRTYHVSLLPLSVRKLFRGLFEGAVAEPAFVTDIDEAGWIMMTISIPWVAYYAGGVDVRTIQRAKNAATRLHLVEHSFGPNSSSDWFFCLKRVLPHDAVDWFRDLVETGIVSRSTVLAKSVSPIFGSFPHKTPPPAFCNQTPPPVVANAGGGVSDRTSYCFVLNTARLAELREFCAEHGIAVHGTHFESLFVDDLALENPIAVDRIYLLASDSGVIEADAINYSRVFVAAVVSKRKKIEWPWSYFRSMLLRRHHLTTIESPNELKRASSMQRIAEGKGPLPMPSGQIETRYKGAEANTANLIIDQKAKAEISKKETEEASELEAAFGRELDAMSNDEVVSLGENIFEKRLIDRTLSSGKQPAGITRVRLLKRLAALRPQRTESVTERQL